MDPEGPARELLDVASCGGGHGRTITRNAGIRAATRSTTAHLRARLAAVRGEDASPYFAEAVEIFRDQGWLSNLGKPLLFGPGSILDAHGADEKIGKKELLSAVETYAETVRKLLA